MISPIQLKLQTNNLAFYSNNKTQKPSTKGNKNLIGDEEVKSSTILLSIIGVVILSALPYITPLKNRHQVISIPKDTTTVINDTVKNTFEKFF